MLADRLRARIERHGPISFEAFQEACLYDPDGGFYASGGAAGRRGDFLTSPEVGPLFGAVVARALDAWWAEMGQPDPFVVIDAGAGPGTLARSVLSASPACRLALRYVLVERSELLRCRHAQHLPVEPASVLFAVGAEDAGDEDEGGSASPGGGAMRPAGPLVTSLVALPRHPVVGVVFANELLDNLPVVLLERRMDGWAEVRVGAEGDAFVEVLVPAGEGHASAAQRFAPTAAPGARIPLQRQAAAWVRDALGALARGRVVVVDYASSTPDLASRTWRQWLRTYRGHERGSGPLNAPGTQDITCEVAVDQLAPAPVLDRSQAEFLHACGLEELVEEGRTQWAAGAAGGGLVALRGRSRVREAEALTDPAGLGAFRVLEWPVG